MKKTVFLLLIIFLAAPAWADDGVELEPLTFGQGIITDNSAVRACTIPAGATQTCDAEILLLQPGRSGVFRLSGFDPGVEIWASIDDTNTTLENGSGDVFDVKNFTFSPAIGDSGNAMTPNADGTLIIEIGATLQTRAGTVYGVTPYRGTYTLQINY